MRKNSDGFSDSSYEDLLAEYAGKLSGSKPSAPIEKSDGERPVARQKAERPAVPERRKSRPSVPRPVRQTPPAATESHRTESSVTRGTEPVNSEKFNIDIHSNRRTNSSFDLNQIKSIGSQPYETAPKKEDSVSKNSFFDDDIADTLRLDEDLAKKYGVSEQEPVINDSFVPVSRRSAQKRRMQININRDAIVNKLGRARKGGEQPFDVPLYGEEELPPVKKKKKPDVKTFFKNLPKNILRFIVEKKKLVIVGLCCIVVAAGISAWALSCINDVLAINRQGDTPIEVELPDGADKKTAIKVLEDAGLIKNRWFCTLFIEIMGSAYDKPLLPGVYYFTPDMGVEKMMKQFRTNSKRGALISVSIPEGYTIDQIFERLEKNGVCSAQSLYQTIDKDFSSEYAFLSGIQNKEERYHVLEGYLFPATYEFEEGADPAAVIREFLDAFKARWSDEYAARAQELSMSVDEIITLASIIEKEGKDETQFKQISSVLHNRLNRSGLYPSLECNSTGDYVTNTISKRITQPAQLSSYIRNYNTYESEGLPPGPICNPSKAAIEAALYPDTTQYYYFRHDNKGEIYMAKTYKEHQANKVTVDRVNAADD